MKGTVNFGEQHQSSICTYDDRCAFPNHHCSDGILLDRLCNRLSYTEEQLDIANPRLSILVHPRIDLLLHERVEQYSFLKSDFTGGLVDTATERIQRCGRVSKSEEQVR